jgi:hypothetical protein
MPMRRMLESENVTMTKKQLEQISAALYSARTQMLAYFPADDDFNNQKIAQVNEAIVIVDSELFKDEA